MSIDIETIVKAGIQQEILKALQDSPEYIESLIKSALNQEVNKYGDKPSYGEDKIPYLEYVVGAQLRSFAGKAVSTWLKENEDAIRAAIIERVSQSDIGESFADAVVGTIGNEWRINVSFERERT